MNHPESVTNPQSHASIPRQRIFVKPKDGRGQETRGLWMRNGKFYARVKAEGADGGLKMRWVPLDGAQTVAEAKTALRELFSKRARTELVVTRGAAPQFEDYANTYIARLPGTGKTPKTVGTEKGYLTFWKRRLGGHPLNRIRPHHITAGLHELRASGLAPRSCNLSLTCLRNVLKAAKVDGYITTLPSADVPWLKVEHRPRRLFSSTEIDALCQAAGPTTTKNHEEFRDYIRFLQFTGCREKEALLVRWADVDFESGHLVVGASGGTKNRRPRIIDLNRCLEAHLREMHSRRAPDSQWLFPSPQRGKQDLPARSLRESLRLVRQQVPGMENFGFHDLRHAFISVAVMSGCDILTVARWAGHQDGGLLIGRVYGHLADPHLKRMAAKLDFRSDRMMPPPSEVSASIPQDARER